MTNNSNGLANVGAANAFAITNVTFGLFALVTGRIEGSGLILLAMWLFAGFIVQLIPTIVAILKGNDLDANLGLVLTNYLMLAGALTFTVKWLAIMNNWQLDGRIEGYLWLSVFLVVTCWTPAVLKLTPMVFNLAVICIDPALLLLCLSSFGVLPPYFVPILGYDLLLIGILTLWVAVAMILNSTFQKTIIPVGSPLIKS
jgi:succinate-acetate transporter protein